MEPAVAVNNTLFPEQKLSGPPAEIWAVVLSKTENVSLISLMTAASVRVSLFASNEMMPSGVVPTAKRL